MTGTVISTAYRILVRMLEQYGIDPLPLFKKAGIDTAALNKSMVRIPWKQAVIVWKEISDKVDPAFGLSVSRAWQPSDFHSLGCAFMSSNTLRDALNRIIRFNSLVYDVVTYSLVEKDENALLSYKANYDIHDEPAISEDTRWAIVLNACRRIYGEDLNPVEVTFWHDEPKAAKDKFVAYYRCPIKFGEKNACMTFSKEVLDKPLPASNHELALTLDRTLNDYISKFQQEGIIARTKSVISELLPSGHINSQMVADALHMSPRSLQRRLAVVDTTFRYLVEQVRQDLAESYLADKTYSMIEITYMLGFSSQSSFSRAFKRWSGMTPQDYRDAI
ncbi:MAG: AraC family transcriptional regulator [Gammaproteobacteria bacterium]|nr:MAG: AraC family transcriptional regulator [Gammaproteobacteria bacterium]